MCQIVSICYWIFFVFTGGNKNKLERLSLASFWNGLIFEPKPTVYTEWSTFNSAILWVCSIPYLQMLVYRQVFLPVPNTLAYFAYRLCRITVALITFKLVVLAIKSDTTTMLIITLYMLHSDLRARFCRCICN